MKAKNNEVSRNELDEYIRVTSSGIKIIIAVLMITFIATIIWGKVGKIPVTETVTGVVTEIDLSQYDEEDYKKSSVPSESGAKDVVCLCCIDASKYGLEKLGTMDKNVTMKMTDGTVIKGKITNYTTVPVDQGVLEDEFLKNEWLIEECVPGNYNWVFGVRAKGLEKWKYSLVSVSLQMDEVSPVSFMMKR